MAVSDNDQPMGRFDPYGPQDDRDLGERRSDADVWTFDPDIKLPNDAYRGVRRAAGARPHRRIGLAIGIVVAAAAVAVVFVMKPGADTGNRDAGGDSATVTPSDPGAGEPSSPQLSATAGPTSAVPVAASAAGVAAFAPLTFEAEAGPPTVKRRGADVETLAGASGGKVVRFTGGSGDMEIRGVDFTGAGTYRITIYYATATAGTAAVSLPNAAPLTVSFAAGSGCCAAGAVEVALPSGQRTITISQVTSGVAIDRVVITRSRP